MSDKIQSSFAPATETPLPSQRGVLHEVTKLMQRYVVECDPDLVWEMNLWLNTIGYGVPDDTEHIVDGQRVAK